MASKSAYYTKLINSARWRKLRLTHLATYPYCVRCEKEYDLLTAATEVHHIEPVESAHSESEQQALMFNPSNLQSLCHHCHREIHKAAGYHKKESVKARKQLRVEEQLTSLYGKL